MKVLKRILCIVILWCIFTSEVTFAQDMGVNNSIVQEETGDKKIVSILGDSLGTYDGYTVWDRFYFYYCDAYMDSVDNTWWMRYINNHGMKLGINDSLGSTKVSWEADDAWHEIACMASEDRIARLGSNGVPDVIFFMGGTNDIVDSELGVFNPEQEIGDISTFYSAYQTAIMRLQLYYPNAEIICLTPYYRDTRRWSGDVDAYADAILEVCEFYGVSCVDLRKADIDSISDMCTEDYLHVNENGHYKIWHMLEYGIPQLSAKTIKIKKNVNNYILAEYEVNGKTEDTQFQWQVYDCSIGEWIYTQEWTTDSELSYKVPHSGEYWLACTARNSIGEEVKKTVFITCQEQKLEIHDIVIEDQSSYLDVSLQYTDIGSDLEFRWQVYNLDTEQWFLLSDWSEKSPIKWMPDKGNYWIYVEAKENEDTLVSYIESYYADRKYPAYITGKYQGPNPYGEGWLLGVSSNINPEQSYQYELLILDCDKYVSGDPNPWVYGSGLCNVSYGNTFWTTYVPQHQGYYWTYFRIYDEQGNLIDDACYDAYCTGQV